MKSILLTWKTKSLRCWTFCSSDWTSNTTNIRIFQFIATISIDIFNSFKGKTHNCFLSNFLLCNEIRTTLTLNCLLKFEVLISLNYYSKSTINYVDKLSDLQVEYIIDIQIKLTLSTKSCNDTLTSID